MEAVTREDLIGHIEDAAYDGITDVAVSRVHKLFDELDKLRAEVAEARGDAERIRQKAIVAQSERDHARVEFKMLQYRLEAAGSLISQVGCDCPCDHDAESHDEHCERCIQCLLCGLLWPRVSK